MNMYEKNADLLPGINHILEEARTKLKMLTGTDVFITISETPKELNEVVLETLICKEFAISWKSIEGPYRTNVYVDARSVYCYLAYCVLKQTKSEIARKLNRHHSSVIHLIKRYNNLATHGGDELLRKSNSIETKIRMSYECVKN